MQTRAPTSAVQYELRGLLTAASAAVAAVLLLASINFDYPLQDVFHSLRFHLAVAALTLPLLLFATGARWRAIGMLLIIVASLAQGAWIIQGQRALRAAATDPATRFQVFSFNVLANSEQGENVAEYIEESGFDLVVLMESPGIERALQRLEKTLPYRIGCENSDTCDLTVLSRTPLADATVHLLGPFQRERFVTATTTIDGRPVTVAALHLSKPYYDGAAVAELWQVSHVLESIEGPLVVAGDFNAAPWSNSIARFIRRNALIPAPAYPATWPVRLGGLGIPIDSIYTRSGLQIETIRATEENFGSNHRGLVARLGSVVSD